MSGPQPMTGPELAVIRERDASGVYKSWDAVDDRRALLAHIDAITEAVEHMPTARIISQWDLVSRRAVLTIIRGEP